MIDIKQIKILSDDDMGDILECLSNLFSITEGTQPLDRQLGLKGDYIGLPIPVAQNKFSLDVYDKVAEYEPRAEVVDIQFSIDLEGKMTPIIKVRRA